MKIGIDLGGTKTEGILIDELWTPDSSRYWDKDDYVVGKFPPAFDKQFLREWLLKSNWDLTYPPPKIPNKIINDTKKRYLESFKRLTS